LNPASVDGHTEEALSSAAAVAWHHHARLAGWPMQWPLTVLDRRTCIDADEVFGACLEHLAQATNDGKVRPLITVFAPRTDRAHRIWNSHLVRYGCWEGGGGELLGDPLNLELTGAIEALGWRPRGGPGPFVPLPLVIEPPRGRPQLYELPRELIFEVPITHPEYDWFARLGLRWPAVSPVSGMVLRAGHTRYTAVFNGWHAGHELSARSFVEFNRYNLLLRIARGLMVESDDDARWIDLVALELDRAVRHSYRSAGVTVSEQTALPHPVAPLTHPAPTFIHQSAPWR
jgi:nitric-oxide synthase